MLAVQIESLDGPAALQVRDVEPPRRAPGDVLIEVHAVGVTFPELLQTRGLYQDRPDLPFVPGYEVAGIVLESDPGSRHSVGDRVVAFGILGGYAEIASIREEHVFACPDGLDLVRAASVPMNYLTAHFALVRRGRIAAGESVLVHGAGGGVGVAAIQVAKAWGAGQVVAVASDDHKAGLARAAGADEVVPATGFREAVDTLTDGRGVDLVVDPVGGDRFLDTLRCLRPWGRALVVGFAAGGIPQIPANRVLLRNVDVVGAGWGSFAWDVPGYLLDQWEELRPHLESGRIDPAADDRYGLVDAARALQDLDERRPVGKLVLRVR